MGPILSALGYVVGTALVGAVVSHVYGVITGVPRFRVSLGQRLARDEETWRTVTVENIGPKPVPPYRLQIYHPLRGTLDAFRIWTGSASFPQHPRQQITFEVQMTPPSADGPAVMVKRWLEGNRDGGRVIPHFDRFRLQIQLESSDHILFSNEGLGNTFAARMYEDIMHAKLEHARKPVGYVSQAYFWVKLVARAKARRRIAKRRRRKDKNGIPEPDEVTTSFGPWIRG